MPMSDKIDKHLIQELKERVREKKPDEPVEKILTVFCERTGVSMNTCRVYYKRLVEKGEIKEK
jgi:DNA-binding Lrp family transcriptional regulator